jgi:hypothetical protein
MSLHHIGVFIYSFHRANIIYAIPDNIKTLYIQGSHKKDST